MKTDLIEILYSEKVILDGKRTEQDVAFSVERAARINSLMERKIFNEEFIRELQQRTLYSEIESCYTFIVKTIMSRANRFETIKGKNYHVIVTGELSLKNDTVNDEVFIVLGWPLIKFIDLLNTNALCSSSYDEHFNDSCAVLAAYLNKFRYHQSVNLFSSLYPLSAFKNEQYQLLMMLQQIQTVFILSHELGHLLHPDITGLHGEILSDSDGIQAVYDYTFGNQKLNFYIVIAIMMLFSYLSLADVTTKATYKEKTTAWDNWMDRYDSVYKSLSALELSDKQMALVAGYEKLCGNLDRLCWNDIDSSEA